MNSPMELVSETNEAIMFRYDYHTFFVNKEFFVKYGRFANDSVVAVVTSGIHMYPVKAKSLYGSYIIHAISGIEPDKQSDVLY